MKERKYFKLVVSFNCKCSNVSIGPKNFDSKCSNDLNV